MINNLTMLFNTPNNASEFVYGDIDPIMALMSFFIAIIACFVGFHIAQLAKSSYNFKRRHLILFSGSLALGIGVWAMHFIGMLAFDLGTHIHYDPYLTIGSFIPAMVSSWITLNILMKKKLHMRILLVGGVLVGSGIGAMHYIGMAAMESMMSIHYDFFMFCLSIVVAILLAMLSLWVHFGLNQFTHYPFITNFKKILIASCIMGMAISSMHYIGMYAVRFTIPESPLLMDTKDNISLFLGLTITVITSVVMAFVCMMNMMFRYQDISIKAKTNESYLKTITNTSIDGVITLDENGHIVSANKVMTTLFGWTEEELLTKGIHDFMPKQATKNSNDFLMQNANQKWGFSLGQEQDVIATDKHNNRVIIRLVISHVVIRNKDTYVAFLSDISERAKMQSDLQESEEKFRSLVSNIPGIVFRCKHSNEQKMLFISPAVEKVTGYTSDEFLSIGFPHQYIDLLYPDDKKAFLQTIQESETTYYVEYRIITKEGKIKWLFEHGRKIKQIMSNDIYIDGFIMDISKRKSMEQELILSKEQAELAAASRAAFLANMSHEIRTPMNSIIGFSNFLLEDEINLNTQKDYLNTINKSAKSLLHLLNDVLDSAKLDKGKMDLELKSFSLIEEIDSIISTLWLQAQHKGLLLELNLSSNLAPYYWGAPERIRQVLTNIIGNAIKFTEKGGIILSVYKSTSTDHITFSIQDSGIGMTEAHIARIFDAFTQADSSMHRKFGGTGLGTTISKQLIELMGGTITVSSKLDVGTEFIISIPLEETQQRNIIKTENTVQLPPLKILVVDDIQQNIDLLTILLTRDGHSVTTALNGEQALTEMQKTPPDIVLMDIQMPIMDGLETAKKRRLAERQEHIQYIPIIALTAGVLAKDKIDAKSSGMDGFSHKPVDFTQLKNEIACILNIPPIKKPVSLSSHSFDKNELINLPRGIELWGSEERYYEEISYFLTKIPTSIQELQNALAEETIDSPNAIQAIHTLKGVSGNLALPLLMDLFSTLERMYRTQNFPLVKATYKQITLEIDKLTFRINNKNREEEQVSLLDGKENQKEIALFLTAINELLEFIRHNEANDTALKKVDDYAPKSQKAKITTIVNALNDFEFETAENTLQEIKEHYDKL